MFDACDDHSFAAIEAWVKECKAVCGGGIQGIFLGNKVGENTVYTHTLANIHTYIAVHVAVSSRRLALRHCGIAAVLTSTPAYCTGDDVASFQADLDKLRRVSPEQGNAMVGGSAFAYHGAMRALILREDHSRGATE